MMNEVIPAVVLVLMAAGCFCLGGLWQAVRVQFLREVLTGVEHDRARLEGPAAEEHQGAGRRAQGLYGQERP
jgi:hypothetical protein